MMPEAAAMYIVPVADHKIMKDRVEFWKDVHGFNMSAIK